MDMHTVSISVTPGEAGKQPTVSIEPPNDVVRFAVAARTMSGGRSNLSVARIDDAAYKVTGNIPRDAGTQRWRFPLTNPARYAAQSFKTILAREGIAVPGDVAEGRTPEGATILASVPSPALKRLVTEMNMHSLNVAADNLLLAMVSNPDGAVSTRVQGVAILQEHLKRHGISPGDAQIADGSGLLPANRVTPRGMARYLAAVSHQPWFRELRDSLPRPGLDGTLRNGTYRNERFRAKSGNLENVTALAGYGVDKSGREIAFAFIAESPTALPPNARNAGDAVIRYLAE
jgi:D-alanyl-D-alanine carboxypeptidase/D-alanyl-D-alanine-endopeptidase (penicillin-binding protein 4)